MGKNKSLKVALHSQQKRLKVKEKLAAAKTRQPSFNRSVRRRQGIKPACHPIIPFKTSDRILLIGEGNFSFARALVHEPPKELGFLPPENITATAYDTEDECYDKYPECPAIIAFLRERGVQVVFGVDARYLEKHHALKDHSWDRIVWNFPHAGKGISDQDRNILSNQILILEFLRSAAKVLRRGSIPNFKGSESRKKKKEGDNDEDDNDDMSVHSEDEPASACTRGTVLMTLRNVVPYTHWDIPRLAKNPPAAAGSAQPYPKFILLRSFQFYRNMWQGYEHRMTKGERAHSGTGTTGEDRTWELCVNM